MNTINLVNPANVLVFLYEQALRMLVGGTGDSQRASPLRPLLEVMTKTEASHLRHVKPLICLLALFSAGWTHAPVRELKLYTTYGETAQTFDASVHVAGITNGVGPFLKQTVDACRQRAEKDGKSPQSIGSAAGHWLEWSVLIALKQQKLTPAWLQAEFAAVPHNFNDVLLWSKEHGPVVISCKTSLRERYKQADLEAVALRQHYPNARFILVTLDADKRHVASIRKKIAGKELLALHGVYDETNADELFGFLQTLTLTHAPEGVLRNGRQIQ